MSLRASASSFVPNQAFQMDPNIPSFDPRNSYEKKSSAARKIQNRYRKNLTRKKKRYPVTERDILDHNAERKITNRYIHDMDDDIDDMREELSMRRDNATRAYNRLYTQDEKYAVEDPDDKNFKKGQEIYFDDDSVENEEYVSDEEENETIKQGFRDERTRLIKDYKERVSTQGKNIRLQREAETHRDGYKSKLDNIEKLDVMKCKRVRKILDTNPQLYYDSKFYKEYIEPCKDNATTIYIDTFFNIPYDWIWPVGKRPDPKSRSPDLKHDRYNQKNPMEHLMIDKVINKINIKYFSKACKTALIDCLIDLNLMGETRYPGDFRPNYIDELADTFKFGKTNEKVKILHRGGEPYLVILPNVNTNGRKVMEDLLDYFEETVIERGLTYKGELLTKSKIEQMKRYFILLLIGVVQNPDYIDILDKRLSEYEILIDRSYFDSEKITTEIRDSIDIKSIKLKSWISSVQEFF